MTWVRLEDTLPDHERTLRAGDRAMWLWVCGLCWCARHLTDGRIPIEVVPHLSAAPDALELAEKLVEVGLWKRARGAFRVHNYAKYQQTREQVEAVRQTTRERVKRHRSQRSGNAVTNGTVTPLEVEEKRVEVPQTPALSWLDDDVDPNAVAKVTEIGKRLRGEVG